MTHDPATLAAGAAMSRPTDPLRDRIAAIVERHTVLGAPMETADAILALVREHATNDAAVERAAMAWDTYRGPDDEALRAALAAALGGEP